jgi:hypothetical protein
VAGGGEAVRGGALLSGLAGGEDSASASATEGVGPFHERKEEIPRESGGCWYRGEGGEERTALSK